MDLTLDWTNKELVNEVWDRIQAIGNPSNIESDYATKEIIALIWEKDNNNNSSLQGTIFERIEIRNTNGKIFYPKFGPKGKNVSKVFKNHFVSISINYDLTSSEFRDDILFIMKAPIEYFPQKKLLTVYGPSFGACLSTIMVVTNCSMSGGCPVDKVNEKSLVFGAYEFSKKDLKSVSAQVVANIKSSKIPGNPIPETE